MNQIHKNNEICGDKTGSAEKYILMNETSKWLEKMDIDNEIEH